MDASSATAATTTLAQERSGTDSLPSNTTCNINSDNSNNNNMNVVWELLGPPRNAANTLPLSSGTPSYDGNRPLDDHLPSSNTIREKLARDNSVTGEEYGEVARSSSVQNQTIADDALDSTKAGKCTSATGEDNSDQNEIDFERCVDVVARHTQRQQQQDIQFLANAIQENIVVVNVQLLDENKDKDRKKAKNSKRAVSNVSDVGLMLAAYALTALGPHASSQLEACMPVICETLGNLSSVRRAALTTKLTRSLLKHVHPTTMPFSAATSFVDDVPTSTAAAAADINSGTPERANAGEITGTKISTMASAFKLSATVLDVVVDDESGSTSHPRGSRQRAAAAARQVFAKWVVGFQSYVMLRCMMAKDPQSLSIGKDDTLLNAVVVLDLLNRINDDIRFLPSEEFYNASVMENMNLKDEYPKWKSQQGITFLDFPFLLDSSSKGDVLKIESMISMRRELQDSFFRAMFIGVNSPYLQLEVRRDSVVRDAISQLANKSDSDLKKQLRISFVGEEGIDEGGIQKEFFQLVVNDIFDPSHGMFEINSESRLCWFSRDFPEDDGVLEEYTLIGKLLGLAIYNNITLSVPFPLALFKKLLVAGSNSAEHKIDLEDLRELDPLMAKGLEALIDTSISANDLDILLDDWTFDVTGRDGTVVSLLANGQQGVKVTRENAKVFINAYVDYIMNQSVQNGFEALKKGFDSVVAESALQLFRPVEFRQLTVGCEDLDFLALERNTQYDGWDKDTQFIKDFWSIVHAMTDDEKRALLVFTTGSDKVPVGGLGKLQFVVARNGPDCDRLPSSHTCYNVLLLNEYSSKGKLEERLRTALKYARCGFFLL